MPHENQELAAHNNHKAKKMKQLSTGYNNNYGILYNSFLLLLNNSYFEELFFC